MDTGEGAASSCVMEKITMGKIIKNMKKRSFRTIITVTLIIVVATMVFIFGFILGFVICGAL